MEMKKLDEKISVFLDTLLVRGSQLACLLHTFQSTKWSQMHSYWTTYNSPQLQLHGFENYLLLRLSLSMMEPIEWSFELKWTRKTIVQLEFHSFKRKRLACSRRTHDEYSSAANVTRNRKTNELVNQNQNTNLLAVRARRLLRVQLKEDAKKKKSLRRFC